MSSLSEKLKKLVLHATVMKQLQIVESLDAMKKSSVRKRSFC